MARRTDWNEYYTPQEAVERLRQNSGKKEISIDYLRSLVRYGVLHPKKIGNVNMYLRSEINPYIVEERGANLKRRRQEQRSKKPVTAS